MTALSAMPASLSPAVSGAQLGQGHSPGSPAVPPLTALHSASATLLYPTLKNWHGPMSWTPSGLWVLQWDVLWRHRTPLSSQGPSCSGIGGPYLPVSLSGRWPLVPGFLSLRPGRWMAWMSLSVPSWLVQRGPQCRGLPAARLPTPVVATSAVQRKWTAGAYGPPPIMSSPTTPSTAPYHSTTWSHRPGHQWSCQGSGFGLPPSLSGPGRIPQLWPRVICIAAVQRPNIW